MASSKTTILPLFLSTPSARRATVTSVALLTSSKFLSTPSARRATLMKSAKAAAAIFLSTPSARRATVTSVALLTSSKFLSTPSARRATVRAKYQIAFEIISIHALREEGDSAYRASRCQGSDFYPRPPRGGRPSCRPGSDPTKRISIHALREEGDCRGPVSSPRRGISIHALREEGDGQQRILSPRRGISIHALREEGDPRRLRRCLLPCHFYPRPPRGGRHQIPLEQWYQTNFYPRPPRGGRRAVHRSDHGQQPISIHALREEGDGS